jgi:hypothetical protein
MTETNTIKREAVIASVAKKLRSVVEEHGEQELVAAAIVGTWVADQLPPPNHICGLPFFAAPTVGRLILANTSLKVARTFEEA